MRKFVPTTFPMSLTILLPVYNDWTSLQQLVKELANLPLPGPIHLLVVNDGGQQKTPADFKLPEGQQMTLIHLLHRMGHQRALACGLCYATTMNLPNVHPLVVMDADGEDRPQDLPFLLQACRTAESPSLVFALRSKRSEGLPFRFSYWSYRLLFKIMTGKQMRFGNFSCLPASLLPALVQHPDLWNHYAGTALKSDLPIVPVPTERGKRYAGNSHHSFNRLVLHGLSALSIHMDLVLVRFLKLSLLLFFLFIVALGALLYVKFATSLAIPGWTSFLFSNILGMMLTLTGFTFLVVLQQLQARNRKQEAPIRFYREFIGSIEEVNHG